jgi:hypothetical protein
MRRTLPFILASLSLLAQQQPATPSSANKSSVLPPPVSYQFPVGQTLIYDADWRLFNAGTATIRLEGAGREHRILTTADAAGMVSVLYHVHDVVESFFDPKTFCSRTINKHTEEGRRRLTTNIVFDYARKKSVLDELNHRDKKNKHEENDIPACVTDVVASVFYIASLPLAPNATYTFPLNDGGKTADVQVVTEDKEELRLPSGAYKTVRVRVSSDTGKLKDKGQIWLWLTDDARRLPVQMKARMFWGTLVFRLQKIEGQKPPA